MECGLEIPLHFGGGGVGGDDDREAKSSNALGSELRDHELLGSNPPITELAFQS